jgi:hypothetical protein
VEVVGADGQHVPNAAIPVRSSISGPGELAAQGGSSPNDATRFRVPLRKTYEGRCLPILRLDGGSGKITLKAEARRTETRNCCYRTRSHPFKKYGSMDHIFSYISSNSAIDRRWIRGYSLGAQTGQQLLRILAHVPKLGLRGAKNRTLDYRPV